MKLLIAALACLTLATAPAFAEGNKSSSFSESYSSSRANNNNNVSNNTKFQDRRQAPGFGVGGGYCSNGLSVSGPGFGFGFSSMDRMCKVQIGAGIAKDYLGKPSAVEYVCQQGEFKSLNACKR